MTFRTLRREARLLRKKAERYPAGDPRWMKTEQRAQELECMILEITSPAYEAGPKPEELSRIRLNDYLKY